MDATAFDSLNVHRSLVGARAPNSALGVVLKSLAKIAK